MKIFEDKQYIFNQIDILDIDYIPDSTYPRFQLFCKAPNYKTLESLFFLMPVDGFLDILKHFGDNGHIIKDKLKKALTTNDNERFSIGLYDTIGEPLESRNLTFFCTVSEVFKEDNWVHFNIQSIELSNEAKTEESKTRKINEIAYDIYLLALRNGYEYGAMFDYLEAMKELETMDDYYEADRASYIVKAFMGNIRYWKIDEIKPLRKELKALITD